MECRSHAHPIQNGSRNRANETGRLLFQLLPRTIRKALEMSCLECKGKCCEAFTFSILKDNGRYPTLIRKYPPQEGFIRVALAFRALGIRIISLADGTVRCSKHNRRKGTCRIYEKRPEICKNFTCRPMQAPQHGPCQSGAGNQENDAT